MTRVVYRTSIRNYYGKVHDVIFIKHIKHILCKSCCVWQVQMFKYMSPVSKGAYVVKKEHISPIEKLALRNNLFYFKLT